MTNRDRINVETLAHVLEWDYDVGAMVTLDTMRERLSLPDEDPCGMIDVGALWQMIEAMPQPPAMTIEPDDGPGRGGWCAHREAVRFLLQLATESQRRAA